MTDIHFTGTTKIKALADIRPINVDDTDSILHAFYRNIKAGKATSTHGLLPNITAEEKKLLAEKEKEISQEPEKRQLDGTAQQGAEATTVSRRPRQMALLHRGCPPGPQKSCNSGSSNLLRAFSGTMGSYQKFGDLKIEHS